MPDMSQRIGLTLKSLNANHFDARSARTADEARKIILEMIPLTASIGVGDSATLRQIGILDDLARRKSRLINPFTLKLTQGTAEKPPKHGRLIETARRALNCDVFLTGSNAVTEDGKIVSIDRAGNRVAGIIFGAPRVILAVGRNKLVKDVDEAVYRIKNVIAPAHALRKGRKTPCAATGRCTDCDSPDRVCSVTIILEKKPLYTDLSIVLIDEDLGLGWDPAWDNQRITEIRSNYYRNTWAFLFPKP